jgi:alginate O-acetyltransferase complex protein AlgI
MKRSIAILLALMLIGLVGDMRAPYRRADIDISIGTVGGSLQPIAPTSSVPAYLDEQSRTVLRVRNAAAGFAIGGNLRIQARGGELYVRTQGSANPIGLGPDYDGCVQGGEADLWDCTIPFRFEGASWLDIAAVTGTVAVTAIDPVVVKASSLASVGIGSLLAFFAALSVVALLLLRVNMSASLRAMLLAATGAVWLVASGVVGGIALIVVTSALYLLLRMQLNAPDSSGRFIAAAGVIALVFVLVKMHALPWSGAFANPGGMSLGVPLGFAFFIVRALDLSFRIATREVSAMSVRDYFSYMLFPATLAAGPIYTLNQFRQSAIDSPTIVDWSAGLARIAVGLFKKLLADLILVRAVGPGLMSLYAGPSDMSAGDLWLMLAANALYVYLDFSAYSDIAIGIGRQLGFKVPENFDFPFLSSSMRSFWRRWHITLSQWVARWVHFYTAFSLRRSSRLAQGVLPVVTSLLLIGLWHEMQLSWIMWGLHHAGGILLGDIVFGIGAVAVTGASLTKIGWRSVAGMLFVWAWVALSHCFTLISDPQLSLEIYRKALTLGLL